jgi:hypothetical protein
MFAILRNCSSRFRGRNVITVYLEVMTWLDEYTCCLRIFPLGFLYSAGSSWWTKTERGGPGAFERENRLSTLKAASFSYHEARVDLRGAMGEQSRVQFPD